MRKDITVAAESRDSRGKNEARRLRAQGSMPAVVYGGAPGPTPVAVSPKQLTAILNSKTGHNTIFNLAVTGSETTPVMIIDWQYDPIKDSLLHVDMKRIDLTRRISVKVPVVTHGDPKGVKLQGGLHEVVTREVEVECLPDDIPEQFTMDVSELMIGQALRASDIPMAGSMKLLSPADAVISHVVSMRAEETTTAETGGVAATPAAEPEVIKKGKKEEEGGAEPAKKK
ncbi:MAG: 50S ribosomal protein L25 [Acidobacteriaceae bacterium]|nr:50S ribosomal protein L25 [Acidobacteriaceae bacterium]MBV8572740.1 50S ribosomal protein L25 [Acidobacteriaceae bacterium]